MTQPRGMTIYHCDGCGIEWGWMEGVPPPFFLESDEATCPVCHEPGVLGAFDDDATP